MHYAWQPSPQGIDIVAAQLRPLRHDPDRYWENLVGLLHDQLVQAIDEHREHCNGNRDCRTCLNLACLETTIEGHNAVQPSGCACPDHRVYPHRLLLAHLESNVN